jgi:hypothetical protein
MGAAGWKWIVNDPAYTFFCIFLLPFVAAAFSCRIEISFLKRLLRPSGLSVLLWVILGIGVSSAVVYAFRDVARPPVPPFMFADERRTGLDALHEQILSMVFHEDSEEQRKEQEDAYRKIATGNGTMAKSASYYTIALTSALNGMFVVFIGWYLFCEAMILGRQAVNDDHVTFIITVLALWFPCRAYAEWYRDFGSMRWMENYDIFWVLAMLLVMMILVLKLASEVQTGMLVSNLRWVSVILVSGIAALAKIKPEIIKEALRGIYNFGVLFQITLGLMCVSFLLFVFNSIHIVAADSSQKPAPSGSPSGN